MTLEFPGPGSDDCFLGSLKDLLRDDDGGTQASSLAAGSQRSSGTPRPVQELEDQRIVKSEREEDTKFFVPLHTFPE